MSRSPLPFLLVFSRIVGLALVLAMPAFAEARSSVHTCPDSGIWHNCWGELKYPSGARYVGEWKEGHFGGLGVYIHPDGRRHVGEWKTSWPTGEGIEYRADGTVARSGTWSLWELKAPSAIGLSRFPFDLDVIQASSNAPLCLPGGAAFTGEVRFLGGSGPGIEYSLDGSVLRSGSWSGRTLTHQYNIDTNSKYTQHLKFDLVPCSQSTVQTASGSPGSGVQAQAQQRLTEKVLPNAESEGQAKPSLHKIERRVALLIGNSAYRISPLENPANDAADMDAALRRAGFQTTLVRNATLAQIREATRRFADQLPLSDVALIYFAGHGIESNRKNYLIPVNAELKFEYELSEQAYDASVWLEMLESVKSRNADRVNIVILDACRNNTLIGSRSLGRGLGRMDAPTGTFLAYSTAPGKVAADGGRGERNSPFTRHLLRAMQQPGLPIEEVFKEVRRNVTRETGGTQVPWESTSLTGYFSFSVR